MENLSDSIQSMGYDISGLLNVAMTLGQLSSECGAEGCDSGCSPGCSSCSPGGQNGGE